MRLDFPAKDAAPTLPLALGGVGIGLLDLTRLYAGLAHDGRSAAPHILKVHTPDAGTSMTHHAARMLTDILRSSPPPDGRNTAAPLLFAVFDRLPTETEPDPLARVPDALRTATQAPVSRGLPIPTPAWAAVPSWQPDGPGFVKVTVVDAAGRRASATVRVR